MRYLAEFVSCLLLALTLTACTAVPDAATSVPATKSDEPTPETAAEATPQPTATLTHLTTTWDYVMGPDAVYKPVDANGDGLCFASTIDFATGQQKILCHKSGCTHADETCPAFMADFSDGIQKGSLLIPAGDKLYWIADGRTTSGGAIYIDVSSLDGSNRRRILEGEIIPNLRNIQDWYTDGSALYATLSASGDFYLLRIDETGLNTLCWKSTQGREGYFSVGCWQDKIVVQHCSDYIEPELGDAATQEEYDAFDNAWDAARDAQPYTLYLFGTDGNVTETGFHWTMGDGAVTLVRDGIAYLLNESGDVTKMNLTSGTSTSHQLELPARVWSDSDSVPLRGYIPVSMSVSGTVEENTDYLLNQDTGEYFQLPASWFKDQTTARSPYVVAAGDEMLYVLYNEVYYTKNDIGPDGQSYSFTTCRNEYGLISIDDYLAGRQNWLPVRLLNNDSL